MAFALAQAFQPDHNSKSQSPNRDQGPSGRPMPTLFRFLYWCALIAGIIYAILFSLANLVEPRPRDATIEIPSERTNPPVQDPAQNPDQEPTP